MNALLLVGIGGLCGAIGRYLVGAVLPSTAATTMTVNVAGSFALGALVAMSLGDPLLLALGTGFCGAFTTFSSFAVETVRLAEAGESRTAFVYATVMAVAAITAIALGGALVMVVT